MRKLLNTIEQLQTTALYSNKIAIILEYFKQLPSEELNHVVHLLLFPKKFQLIQEEELLERFKIKNEWNEITISDCLDITDNLLETISLLTSNNKKSTSVNLIDILQEIKQTIDDPSISPLNFIESKWYKWDNENTFLFHLIVTGQISLGIQTRQIHRAISLLYSHSEEWVAQQLWNSWDRQKIHFSDLLKGKNELSIGLGTTYNIQLQHIYNNSFTEEVFSFDTENRIPVFVISDKEKTIIQYLNKSLQSFDSKLFIENKNNFNNTLLAFIVPKNTSTEIDQSLHKKSFPIDKVERIELIDILESSTLDLNSLTYSERYQHLKDWNTQLSPIFQIITPAQTESKQFIIPLNHQLKEPYSVLHQHPYTLYAVLTHATIGMGRRETFYTDFSFSVKNQAHLKNVIKLRNAECKEFTKFIQQYISKNTIQKFGNLVSVQPELIFEISFTQCSQQKNLSFKNVSIKRQISNISLDYISKMSDFEDFKSI